MDVARLRFMFVHPIITKAIYIFRISVKKGLTAISTVSDIFY